MCFIKETQWVCAYHIPQILFCSQYDYSTH